MAAFYDGFISYGRADSKAFAVELCDRISQLGYSLWFDFNDIPLGVDFQHQINDGIEKSHNFVFIISPHAVNSPYCTQEIELALRYHKRIIPLLHVEQIDRDLWQQRYPDGSDQQWQAYQAQGRHSSFPNLNPAISKINWVYFREGVDDFEQSLQGLRDIFERHRPYVSRHTQLLTQALEWERHQKQTRYLLVQQQRLQAEAWLAVRFRDELAPCTPADLHCEFITESTKNAHNLMTQVFLAHAEADRETMEKIRRSLRRQGITVWSSATDIRSGEDFRQSIQRGIEQADNLVYLLSPHSLASQFCQYELEYAHSLNKPILPILVQPTEAAALPPLLKQLQYIDLTDNEREEDYRLDESELLKVLQEEATYREDHKVLLAQALKWERQHRNPSILLRGYNLRQAETWLKTAQARIHHRPTALQQQFITESRRQPPVDSLDVFISYSRSDADFARKLNENLQVYGKLTWFDQESIAASSADFQQEIRRGIEACDNFLFILSPQSVHSPYCEGEVAVAAQLNKRFITVLHQTVVPAELPPELARVQWIDFRQGDFWDGFNQLVRAIETDREHVHQHTKWSQRAIEWEHKQRSEDLLLRGSELAIAQKWLQDCLDQQKQPPPTPLQKDYIAAGQALCDRIHQQEQAQQRRELRRARQIAVGSSLALLCITGLALFAGAKWREATLKRLDTLRAAALGHLASHQQLEGLITAVQAGELMQQSLGVPPEQRLQIKAALMEAVYRTQEINRLTGHTDYATSVSWSPDGQRLVSASADDTLLVWQRDGQPLQTLTGHTDDVYSVQFSPDEKTLASASKDNTVRLWSQDGDLLHTLTGHQDEVFTVGYSPDGTLLYSASLDQTLRLWQPDGTPISTIATPGLAALSADISPDGQFLGVAYSDNSVRLWKRDGTLVRILPQQDYLVLAVSFSPDGRTFATAGDDNRVRLWRIDGTLLQEFLGHTAPVTWVDFSPNGLLASASFDHTVRLWQPDGTLVQTLEGHGGPVTEANFSADGDSLATTSFDNTVRLWRIAPPPPLDPEMAILEAAWSPDAQHVATASQDGTAKIWQADGRLQATIAHATGEFSSLQFDQDSQQLFTADMSGTLQQWSLGGQLLQTLGNHGARVRDLELTPDGQTLASAGEDGLVRLWSPQGELLQTLTGHQGEVFGLGINPQGTLLATASLDQTVRLWDLQGSPLQTLTGHAGGVVSVQFSDDGQTVASASDDNTLRLWQTDGTLTASLVGHQGWVEDVAFHPAEKFWASAGEDGTLRFWSQQGQLLHTFAMGWPILTVEFSPSEQLAFAGVGNQLSIWSLNLDALLQRGCALLKDYLHVNATELPEASQLCKTPKPSA